MFDTLFFWIVCFVSRVSMFHIWYVTCTLFHIIGTFVSQTLFSSDIFQYWIVTALVSRQFVDMSRIRIEGLLAAFPKLVGTGKQHTYIETENVRYVYQPIESLFLLVVTNKQSNILEDLETLRLLSKLVSFLFVLYMITTDLRFRYISPSFIIHMHPISSCSFSLVYL